MTPEEKLECALEALAAHRNTERIKTWYRRWKPETLKQGWLPSETGSLSGFMADHAYELITGEKCPQW